MKSLYSRASRLEGRASKFCRATCPRASASKMYLSAPVIDYAQYFLDRVHIVKQSDYMPSEQDILCCR